MNEVTYEERGRVAVIALNRPDAEKLADAAPRAVAGTKRLLRRAHSIDLGTAIREEGAIQQDCIDSGDFREGVRAFFEKRAPEFTGR